MSKVQTDEFPAYDYPPVIKANADLPKGKCRALLVGTAGTLNLTQIDGTERDNVPVQAGYNPLQVLRVRTGGTAENVWALY